MSLNRYAKRRDNNEKEIIEEFTRHGFTVFQLDRPLDLIVGYNKVNYLIEIKSKKNKLTDPQTDFIKEWKGQYFVCKTVSQANRFIRQILKTKDSINE